MTDPPGTFREIGDPQAEVQRLSRLRQVSGRQICAEADRVCDRDCEIGRTHCPGHHLVRWKRAHDPDHCDRAWEAAHE